jgi:hypothetical protein
MAEKEIKKPDSSDTTQPSPKPTKPREDISDPNIPDPEAELNEAKSKLEILQRDLEIQKQYATELEKSANEIKQTIGPYVQFYEATILDKAQLKSYAESRKDSLPEDEDTEKRRTVIQNRFKNEATRLTKEKETKEGEKQKAEKNFEDAKKATEEAQKAYDAQKTYPKVTQGYLKTAKELQQAIDTEVKQDHPSAARYLLDLMEEERKKLDELLTPEKLKTELREKGKELVIAGQNMRTKQYALESATKQFNEAKKAEEDFSAKRREETLKELRTLKKLKKGQGQEQPAVATAGATV